MRHKRLKVFAILFLGLGLTALQAQNAIPATGGSASGNGGTCTYSVGQVVYTTNAGSNGSVAQGVQQPFEISVVTALNKAKGISLSVSAFPNPTTDCLNLNVDASTLLNIQSMSYELLDMNGKLLETKRLEGDHTGIVTSNLITSIYFLKILQETKEVITFKIIKN
jgi:hypothetical protein